MICFYLSWTHVKRWLWLIFAFYIKIWTWIYVPKFFCSNFIIASLEQFMNVTPFFYKGWVSLSWISTSSNVEERNRMANINWQIFDARIEKKLTKMHQKIWNDWVTFLILEIYEISGSQFAHVLFIFFLFSRLV